MTRHEGRTFDLPFFEPVHGIGPVKEIVINEIAFMGFETNLPSGKTVTIAGRRLSQPRTNEHGTKVVSVRTIADPNTRASLTRMLARVFPGLAVKFMD